MMDGGRPKLRREDRVLAWRDWCRVTTCSGADSDLWVTQKDLALSSSASRWKKIVSEESKQVALLDKIGFLVTTFVSSRTFCTHIKMFSDEGVLTVYVIAS